MKLITMAHSGTCNLIKKFNDVRYIKDHSINKMMNHIEWKLGEEPKMILRDIAYKLDIVAETILDQPLVNIPAKYYLFEITDADSNEDNDCTSSNGSNDCTSGNDINDNNNHKDHDGYNDGGNDDIIDQNDGYSNGYNDDLKISRVTQVISAGICNGSRYIPAYCSCDAFIAWLNVQDLVHKNRLIKKIYVKNTMDQAVHIKVVVC